MSAKVTFELDDKAVVAATDASLGRARNLGPALTSIARAGVASTRRRFQTSRAPDGSAWKPITYRSGAPLMLSTLLMRSISDRPPTATSVEWGSNRVYAAVHQYGIDETVQVSNHTRVVRQIFGRPTKSPVTQNVGAHSRRMRVDARPYLGEGGDDRATWSAILLRHHGEPLNGTLS